MLAVGDEVAIPGDQHEVVKLTQGYLLGSTTPKGLWSPDCGERLRRHLNGLLCQPIEQLAA